ncbi:MAG: OmpA family protein [Candidatus Omnitrophota bacterium]
MTKQAHFKRMVQCCVAGILLYFISAQSVMASWGIMSSQEREERRKQEIESTQAEFKWWPTDASPGPVKDDQRSGYWWWPTSPGTMTPWGNRGYVYVYKIIFDYMEEELPPPKPQELRPSLLIKKIIRNVKIYFDYNKSELRTDHFAILNDAVKALQKNTKADILITGNCDMRGSEAYNLKLGKERALAAKEYMLEKGIAKEHIRIVSKGKMEALAPLTDLVGMQKDRNAHFIVAEVEEIMIPYPGGSATDTTSSTTTDSSATAEETTAAPANAKQLEEGKYIVEEEKDVESEVQVSTKPYTIKKNDTLWKIAKEELGSGHRWKYLYELNKSKISDPNKLKPGVTIIIPIE